MAQPLSQNMNEQNQQNRRPKKNKFITFRADEKHAIMLKEIANCMGISESEVLRYLILKEYSTIKNVGCTKKV
jgi:hypothetical protein